MAKKESPSIHFYDQDFVDIYDQTWAWMEDYSPSVAGATGTGSHLLVDPNATSISASEACFSTFFMVYSNKRYPAAHQLDYFYERQEEDGAIRAAYSLVDASPVATTDNPLGASLPLFAWAEYNLYHKAGNKKRIKEIMPILEKHFAWMDQTFKDESGLFAVPLSATGIDAEARKASHYYIDFNAAVALNALYMSELGEILNDKEIAFKYKRHYFALKTKIGQHMWNEEAGTYFDLDKGLVQVPVFHLGAYWTLLAEIPNEARLDRLIANLVDTNMFGTPHPFPTLAVREPSFSENGSGANGSVYPFLTFMVVKGLEKFGSYELARESTIRHLYYMLDTLHPEGNKRGSVWEAYKPLRDGHSEWEGHEDFPRALYLPWVGLSTIALIIENVIGLYISLPKKTVDWKVPTIEAMGIENLSLKRNLVTILSNKTNRGWEIRLESEKLYYFTIDILKEARKRTLPIPSGKCSMLIDKL